MTQSVATIADSYRARTPRSREMYEGGTSYTAGPAKGAYYYPPYPLAMERGEGCYLWDVDGNKYLDCANHHTAQVLGHNHPRVMEAVRAQMSRGLALGAPMGPEADIAEEMCRRVDSVERIRFVNSGTEATLHAIRLARGFFRKDQDRQVRRRLSRQSRPGGSQRGAAPGQGGAGPRAQRGTRCGRKFTQRG